MKTQFRSKLLSVLLVLVMVLALVPFASLTAFAASGTGTENDPVYVTNYAELKAALEEDKDTWIVVDQFNNGNYYTLISGVDYEQRSLDDSAYECGAINIPTGKNKHLTVNTTIDCRTASTQSGSLLYSFINNRGNLTIDGNGTIAVSFNAGNYANAIIFNQGDLIIDAPITLDASCKVVQAYGRAIMNHTGTFTINDGTYIGFKSNTLGTSGRVGALWQACESTEKESVISGGSFMMKDENGLANGKFALVCSGVDNLTLKGGTFYGIYASQLNLKLSALLGSNCKYTVLGSDYNGSNTAEESATLTVINTNLINTVNVSVGLPVDGELPSQPTISTANATIYAYEWYDGDDQLSNYLDTFDGGKTYRLQIRINTTKEFSKNTEVLFNGQSATVKSFGKDYILCYCDYTAKNQVIDTVQVGLDTPIAGGAVTAPYAYTDTVDLSQHEWYPNVSQYEAGHSFKLTFRIAPKDGYEFSNNLKVVLNGKQATIANSGKDFAICEYTFDIPQQELETVNEINITVNNPTAGVTPSVPSATSNQYTLGMHEWTPNEFIAGSTAKIILLVYPSSGYKFVDGTTTAKVNGHTATISVGQGYARIEYTFSVKNTIDNVTLSMTAPVAGETASTTVEDNSNLYTTTMYWATEKNSATTFNGQFVQGTKYYATFIITTSDPNEFAEGTSVYINGTKYVATWINQGMTNCIQVKDVEFDTPAEAPLQHTVVYSYGDGQGSGDTDYITNGTELTLKAPELVNVYPLDGKVFDYWSIRIGTAMSAETAQKQPNETITITADTFIVAIWKDAPVTDVTYYYYPGEAEGSADWYTVDIGTQITLKECMFEAPEGMQFKAWAIGSLNGEQKQPGEKITINAETYIYAIWEDAPIPTFTITATAGANGSISPSGGVTVAEGEDKTFTITANSGYHIKDVKVNGSSVGTGATYTFENVTANATITVEFEVDTVDHECNPTLVPEDEPDCTTAGKSAYYHCECGKDYEDAQGNTEIDNIETWGILNALGHNPSTAWSTDGEYHWKECTRCAGQQLEKAAHSDTDTNGKCDVCGADVPVPPPAHTHDYGTAWKTDANEHWNECACGDKANKAAHTDSNNDGKCDTCEYQMTNGGGNTETPDNPNNTPDDPSDDKNGLGAGAIVGIVIGSVAVAGVGGFALFWFVIKKKSFADLIAVFRK